MKILLVYVFSVLIICLFHLLLNEIKYVIRRKFFKKYLHSSKYFSIFVYGINDK